MTSIPIEGAARPAQRGRVAARASSLTRIRPELAGLLVLAAVLNLWALAQNGYANEYYSAAVRSMSTSWHAFLYGSFDAAGVMTVDKPPLALWVQALSVRVFGFHSLSMLVPQALMGVASVALVYDLVRRRFGRDRAGSSPGSCSRSRRSASRSRGTTTRTRCWSSAPSPRCGASCGRSRTGGRAGSCSPAWPSGSGFEAKMAAALLVVPAIAAAYLWVAPRGRGPRCASCSPAAPRWSSSAAPGRLLVALTPADIRPWVSGTSDNSIWSLIFGYNGLGPPRRSGRRAGRARWRRRAACSAATPACCRLLDASLGGQAGWLLGFALVGGRRGARREPAAAHRRPHRLADRGRRRVPDDRRRLQLGRRASSTRTTSRCSRRSRPRWSAPARRSSPALGRDGAVPRAGRGRRRAWSTELAVLDALPGPARA